MLLRLSEIEIPNGGLWASKFAVRKPPTDLKPLNDVTFSSSEKAD
jgi:hypothetical protein